MRGQGTTGTQGWRSTCGERKKKICVFFIIIAFGAVFFISWLWAAGETNLLGWAEYGHPRFHCAGCAGRKTCFGVHQKNLFFYPLFFPAATAPHPSHSPCAHAHTHAHEESPAMCCAWRLCLPRPFTFFVRARCKEEKKRASLFLHSHKRNKFHRTPALSLSLRPCPLCPRQARVLCPECGAGTGPVASIRRNERAVAGGAGGRGTTQGGLMCKCVCLNTVTGRCLSRVCVAGGANRRRNKTTCARAPPARPPAFTLPSPTHHMHTHSWKPSAAPKPPKRPPHRPPTWRQLRRPPPRRRLHRRRRRHLLQQQAR